MNAIDPYGLLSNPPGSQIVFKNGTWTLVRTTSGNMVTHLGWARFAAAANPVGAFLTIVLWPSETAGPEDTMRPIPSYDDDESETCQNHHKIPWNNKTYNHQNHPLVKQAGENLKTSLNNQMLLRNHAGPHSPEYHQSIQDLLDDAYEGVAGKGQKAAQDALNNVYKNIEKGISDGTLKPYGNKNVWIP